MEVQLDNSGLFGFRACHDCGYVKHYTKFWRSKRSKNKGVHAYCKPCMNERYNNWVLNNPERHKALKNSQKSLARQRNPLKAKALQRRITLLLRFGLTIEQYQAIEEVQGRRCALCGSDSNGRKLSSNWNVDHSHKTGEIRGLLCHTCNVGLGFYERFKDGIGLEAIEAYLSKKVDYGFARTASKTGDPSGIQAEPRQEPARGRRKANGAEGEPGAQGTGPEGQGN